ncbi:MAG: hypothetical protein PHY34_01790 [Patescibacteria group bacterium]|nr:hypothetical protein [Patescibacteria group bacterium]
MQTDKPFDKGNVVPEEADYVCVPCGYRHHYQHGEKFGECISCLAGTKEGHEDYVEGLEMWEKYNPAVHDPK